MEVVRRLGLSRLILMINLYMEKRSIKLEKAKLELKDEFELIFEKIVTKFGKGAKIDAPKEFLGKKIYRILRD